VVTSGNEESEMRNGERGLRNEKGQSKDEKTERSEKRRRGMKK
jgi:hypothetical protein